MRGYAGKFLEVDLSSGDVREVKFPEEVLRDYIGGRGLAAKVLWDRLGDRWEEVDPLGEENILTVFTGPLTGYFPGGRVCISGKSPQSNGITGSTMGGEFGVELRCAGYDGLIITGRAERPVYLLITDEGCEIRDASHLWGLGSIELLKRMNREVREELEHRHPRRREWREPAVIHIGPAGERLIRVAAVVGKYSHAGGYGGYGAVMGSKNLKAIAVKGTGPLPEPAHPERVYELIDRVCQLCFASDMLRRWGTGYLGYEVGYSLSSEPVRNWQEEWHDRREYGVDRFERRLWVKRYWADFGCPTSCLKPATIRTGPYKGAITDNPDYELQAYLGTNLGIFDPEANAYLSSLVDELGFCGIQTGNLLGFTAELYQRGILTEEDLGFKLEWGDADAFAKLLHLILERKGIGDILAEGTYRAALKIGEMKGVDALRYAVHVKGIEVGAHGIRSGRDYPTPIGYAASPQGGDHTSTTRDAYEDMTWSVFGDSAVVCSFCYHDPLIWEFARAVTGWDISKHRWCTEHGRRIMTLQQAFILLGGPDVYWDPDRDFDNPPRFYEPLPSGPYKGMKADREMVERMKREYFKAMGWDERGIPTRETLQRLGLSYLNPYLQDMRR